jgi:hypothetical protein
MLYLIAKSLWGNSEEMIKIIYKKILYLFSFFFSEIYYHKFGLIIIPTINYILYIFWVLQPKFQLPWRDRVQVGGSGRGRGDIMPLSMLNLFDIFPLFCDTDNGCISDALVRY